MLYRRYGQTDKMVSVLGFGGMRFLDEEVITEQGRERCAELVVKANEMGVNYFDTAPDYCGSHSEDIFGMAFKRMKVPFYVSTKSKLANDPTADAVRRRIETSLKRMHIEKIHFYHMWCIMDYRQYEQIMRPGGPYEGALKAKEEGLIDHICFSAHADGRTVEQIINDGNFEGVTLGYNAINAPFRERGMNTAYEKGIGVATMNSLGGGVIPNHQDYFSFLKHNKDETVNVAALRYNASHKAVSVVLSGMSTMSDLMENVAAFENFEPAETYFEEINKNRTAGMNDLCTGCNYCAGCPQSLEINKLMLSYNEYIFSGKSRWKLLHDLHHKWGYSENQIFSCINCKKCEQKCTQHLDITKRIQEMNDNISKNVQEVKNKLNKMFEKNLGKKIAIYGIGALAHELYAKYLFCFPNDFKNVYLFDKDEKKQETAPLYKGWSVYAPEKLRELEIERIIVCNHFFYDEIREELSCIVSPNVDIVKFDMSL